MEDDQDSGFGAATIKHPPPNLVSLTPFSHSVSPSPRRLSSHFTRPNQPVRAARQLAWVSLQGRLIGAEQASSARTIGGGLSPKEAVAWELFSPIHRILVVAVVAVAAAKSKKNKEIFQLRKAVEQRDQVLLSMQQKLDSLCDQVNYIQDRPGTWADVPFSKNVEFLFNEPFISEKAKPAACACRFCDKHQPRFMDTMDNRMAKASSCDEVFTYKIPLPDVAEREERRMSDLSDWASSVTSSVDIQMNTFAIEQDIYNLKKECEDKDATITELSTFLNSSKVAGSKRIAELEDIIRGKNMRITRLKKDMLVLEQKVVHLTRLRRPSFASTSKMRQLPAMADNLVYDMESTTSSSSSSDSDCPPRNPPQASSIAKSQDTSVLNSSRDGGASRRKEKLEDSKGSGSLVKPTDSQQKSRHVSPLKERSTNQMNDSVSSSRTTQSLSAGLIKDRRRAQIGSKAVATQKRWV